jgi:hypothetical protein
MRVIVIVPDLTSAGSRKAMDVLTKDEWVEERLGKSAPTYSHPDVKTITEARIRLLNAGLDPDYFFIDEHPEN